MRVDILTIFPQAFEGFKTYGVVKRALRRKLLELYVHDIREFCQDKHKQVDEPPYGTGDGMLLKVEPIYNALLKLGLTRPSADIPKTYWRILMSPQGTKLSEHLARQLSKFERLVIICGHYEGVDNRVVNFIDEEISIGDYVLSSGELSAMVLLDAVIRFLPGALAEDSLKFESFRGTCLEYPQWTRPAEFLGLKVPEVLRSGNHHAIKTFNLKNSIAYTLWKRPDLFKRLSFTDLQESYGLTLKELEGIFYEAIWEGIPCRT